MNLEVANVYAYAAGNPISLRDPNGEDPLLAVIGALVGTGYGLVNGIVAGDSRNELIADAVAGAAQGGLIGLTDGHSHFGAWQKELRRVSRALDRTGMAFAGSLLYIILTRYLKAFPLELLGHGRTHCSPRRTCQKHWLSYGILQSGNDG